MSVPSPHEFMYVSDVIQKNICKNSEECYLDDVQKFTVPREKEYENFTVEDNEVNSTAVITN